MAANASKVASAKALLTKFKPWFSKYHGGLTEGALASFMLHESGGNFAAPGDASLGEIGYFQIAAYVPPLFGLAASARMDPETNVALAVLEYELEAAKFKVRYPAYVNLGTRDSYMLGRLAFAVGRGGSYQLADRAISLRYASSGDLYGGILRSTAANGGMTLGSQSPSKVAARVASIPDQFAIADAVDPFGVFGPPEIIPAPPAGAYAIPADVLPLFVRPIPGIVLATLAGGAGLLWYLWDNYR